LWHEPDQVVQVPYHVLDIYHALDINWVGKEKGLALSFRLESRAHRRVIHHLQSLSLLTGWLSKLPSLASSALEHCKFHVVRNAERVPPSIRCRGILQRMARGSNSESLLVPNQLDSSSEKVDRLGTTCFRFRPASRPRT